MPEAGPLIPLLLARLERISVDSPLAHRASGVRGALLRSLDNPEAEGANADADSDHAVDAALEILAQAAAQLRAERSEGR